MIEPNRRLLDQARMRQSFEAHYGAPPAAIARAPGRVNLIGEHTDYNDGFVLPMAIDRAVWIALRPTTDRRVEIHSLDYDDTAVIALDAFVSGRKGWSAYVEGIAWALHEGGYQPGGWQGVIAGDVPLGAGLSSSAAVELATARAFAFASGMAWQPQEMARLGQRAESGWVGVNCGIMDQMIAAIGVADAAVLIDCRSLDTEAVPLPPDTVVFVLDTNTRRDLVDSAYNERRRQCEVAARHFGVPALRDVALEVFEARSGQLDTLIRRRARHVITENTRTLAAAEAMRAGDAATLGRLMIASHESLRVDFEVSSPALDAMVACALAHEACYGARMTGAGFGGCAVALVAASGARSFHSHVGRCYAESTGREASLMATRAADGATLLAG